MESLIGLVNWIQGDLDVNLFLCQTWCLVPDELIPRLSEEIEPWNNSSSIVNGCCSTGVR